MSEGEREGEFQLQRHAAAAGPSLAPSKTATQSANSGGVRSRKGGGGDQLQKAERQAFVSVAAASRIHALEPCLLPRLGCGREEAWVGLGSG